jgi:hypothetical protein
MAGREHGMEELLRELFLWTYFLTSERRLELATGEGGIRDGKRERENI